MYEKLKPLIKQKEENKHLALSFICPFCSQQISLNLMDVTKDKTKQLLSQLNANPAVMLKSTVRNLQFQENQMLAKNKFLCQKNTFLEKLLKELVRKNNIDLRQLPRELLEQDKYNFLAELRTSIQAPKNDHHSAYERMDHTHPKMSKSERTFEETIPSGKMCMSVGDRRAKPPSKSLQTFPQSGGPNQQVGSYYGFEVRPLRQGHSGRMQSSAKEIESRLQRIGPSGFNRPKL